MVNGFNKFGTRASLGEAVVGRGIFKTGRREGGQSYPSPLDFLALNFSLLLDRFSKALVQLLFVC